MFVVSVEVVGAVASADISWRMFNKSTRSGVRGLALAATGETGDTTCSLSVCSPEWARMSSIALISL